MGKKQKPDDCKFYPDCRHLDVLFSGLADTGYEVIILPRDAEPFCLRCEDFEPRRKSSNSGKLQEAHMENDRRMHPRFDATYPVTLKSSRGVTEGMTKNLSRGGACIGCRELLNPGEQMQLTIDTPIGMPLDIPIQVVWSKASDPGEATLWEYYVGIRFEF